MFRCQRTCQTSTNGDANEIWGLVYPSGTTASVVLQFAGGNMADTDVALFAVYGGTLSGVGTYTALGTTQEVTVVIPVGAVAIGGGRSVSQTYSTWTGHAARVEPSCAHRCLESARASHFGDGTSWQV